MDTEPETGPHDGAVKWHHHFSYCAFSYRWITGVWGCRATSSLLDNHRLRPRVHMKHTVEYPRSATTLWCVHSHGTHHSNGQTQQGERERETTHPLLQALSLVNITKASLVSRPSHLQYITGGWRRRKEAKELVLINAAWHSLSWIYRLICTFPVTYLWKHGISFQRLVHVQNLWSSAKFILPPHPGQPRSQVFPHL